MNEQVARAADVNADGMTSAQLAATLSVSMRTVATWTEKGLIPCHAAFGQRHYRASEVSSALAKLGWTSGRLYAPGTAHARRRAETATGMRSCIVCERSLPLDQFITIRTYNKRSNNEYRGPSFECRECRKDQRREWRRKKAEASGKPFNPVGDRKEYEERTRVRRAQLRAERQASRQEDRHERERKRELKVTAPQLDCRKCKITKDRSEFYPSVLDECRTCVRRYEKDINRLECDTLADAYIKRQLCKSGLRQGDVPADLIEAKRAQLLIERVLHPHRRPSGSLEWLREILGRGPVLAELLNAMARRDGIARETLRQARRRLGATYNATASTWSLKRETHEDT